MQILEKPIIILTLVDNYRATTVLEVFEIVEFEKNTQFTLPTVILAEVLHRKCVKRNIEVETFTEEIGKWK